MNVTIAGEDSRFCGELSDILVAQGYRVGLIGKVGRAVETLRQDPPHLLVVVKPFLKDALGPFLHAIRSDAGLHQLAILCVNPKGSSEEIVSVLDAGADDFIARPFNPQIFLARVRTLLRRGVGSGAITVPEDSTVLRAGPLTLRLLSRQVEAGGKPVALTRLEFDLLAFLLKDSEKVFSRQDILEAVWNYPVDVETRTLEKHVENLRRKLGPLGRCVQTVHGVGYRFLPASSKPSRR